MTTNTLSINQTKEANQPLTCTLCGHTGPEVHYDQAYVGGSGYTWFAVCRDEKACSRRLVRK